MKLADMPPGSIDWSLVSRDVQPGESGSAAARACRLGEVQLRIVEYGAGYVADHWCNKGHILFVLAGGLVIEHSDGSRYALSSGVSWHVADDAFSAHRVVCDKGATVFIVD